MQLKGHNGHIIRIIMAYNYARIIMAYNYASQWILSLVLFGNNIAGIWIHRDGDSKIPTKLSRWICWMLCATGGIWVSDWFCLLMQMKTPPEDP